MKQVQVHPNNQELINRILESDETSYWLKDAIKTLFNRDIVDAVNDVELLLNLLNKELDSYK